jgi:hypothetical protein
MTEEPMAHKHPEGGGFERARHHLLALHKAIIDAERSDVERLDGRLTGGEMLRRLITDERFSWLRPLTDLIVRLDEPDSLAAARRLLRPDGTTEPFDTHYARLLQDSPDVVMAHAAAIRALQIAHFQQPG